MISQHTYISKPSVDEAKDVSRAVRGVLRLQAEASPPRSAIGWRAVVVPVAAAAMALGLAISAASAQAAERAALVYRCQTERGPPEFIEGNPAITLDLTRRRWSMAGQSGPLRSSARLFTLNVPAGVKVQVAIGDVGSLVLTRPEIIAGTATVSTEERTDGGKPVACVRR